MTNPTRAADNLTMKERLAKAFKWKEIFDDNSDAQKAMEDFIRSELDRQREEIVRIIQNRKPNEFAIRKYKTMEARTWDDKNLLIEEFDDIISAITPNDSKQVGE